MPQIDLTRASRDYALIERAVHWLDTAEGRRREPDALAAALDIDQAGLNDLFVRWAGIAPERFLPLLTRAYVRKLLSQPPASSGRAPRLAVSFEPLSPARIRRRGEGMTVRWGVQLSPFGEALLGVCERGLCWLGFVPATRIEAREAMRRAWPGARQQEDPSATEPLVQRIFSVQHRDDEPLAITLQGTAFQLSVWRALLRVPFGQLTSYSRLAATVGAPQASRAVGQAVGANPVAWLVSCHRVVRASGAFGHYQSGPLRKRAMLGWEAAQLSRSAVGRVAPMQTS